MVVSLFLVYFRFIELIKSKTPKVTLYTKQSKCMLMENKPNADFEVLFYDGQSTLFPFRFQTVLGNLIEMMMMMVALMMIMIMMMRRRG